jgi:hypothetical protein
MDNRTQQAMACPVDGATLVMSDRQGIEIDYCPTCRGVWLDRGELDKIIERSEGMTSSAEPAPTSEPWPRRDGHHDLHRHYRKRRKSFLEELFD